VLAGEATSADRGHIWPALIEVDSLIDRLDLEKIFARNAPLHIDLGCGDGSFICALAQRMPEKSFLGIERLLGRIRIAARKAANIGNVRLLRMESSYAVRYLLPAGSVKSFISCSPIPGQNGVTGGTGSSRKIFWAQLVRRWSEMEPSASRPTTLITLKGLKTPRRQVLILRWSNLPTRYSQHLSESISR